MSYKIKQGRREQQRDYRQKEYLGLRQQVTAIFGDVCSVCKEVAEPPVLHHNNLNGPEERKQFGSGGQKWLRSWKKAIEDPDSTKYSVMCHHCHSQFHRPKIRIKGEKNEYDRQYYLAHRQRIREQQRQYRLAHSLQINERKQNQRRLT